ncbi:citronellol/citronellal dehydrogenase [Zavarzinia compransoris]|nr:citronellol/citronellal dehydrogenase [Zavarzinia compransoris]
MERFGYSDDELLSLPLSHRGDLLAGRVALVSGAGTGIGKAIAVTLGRLGARLVVCGRKPEKLEATAQLLARAGAEVLAHPLSIRDPDAVAALYLAARDRFGGIDILVNNAGGQFPQAAIDFSPKGFNAVIDTNLAGTWHMMQAAARQWRDQGRPGAIVNIVAVVGRGMPGVAHTCAARAGVIALSKTVAIEWAPLGIRVNCIAPGIIATEGMNVYPDEARADMPNTNLMRRFGTALDVAELAVHLAGPGGNFITGEVVHVDGGNQIWGDQWTIPRPDWYTTPQASPFPGR